jgi:hypothetical protein
MAGPFYQHTLSDRYAVSLFDTSACHSGRLKTIFGPLDSRGGIIE